MTAINSYAIKKRIVFSISLLVLGILSVSSVKAVETILLVPDWNQDRILSFDSVDGHLLNENLIVDSVNLQSPKSVIASGQGTILVSDQFKDAIYEYGLEGSFIRVVANLSTNGIDNVRGIAVSNDTLYITVGSGIYGNTIRSILLTSPYAEQTWANLALSNPYDILFLYSIHTHQFYRAIS